MARAAGRLAGRWLPTARRVVHGAAKQAAQKHSSTIASQWIPAAKQSGQFVKHVVPAAVKPLHALWHQILGFGFVVLAGLVAIKIWRAQGSIEPLALIIYVFFIVVMAGYGISSIIKSNRISRS
jgi:hypothetical protein